MCEVTASDGFALEYDQLMAERLQASCSMNGSHVVLSSSSSYGSQPTICAAALYSTALLGLATEELVAWSCHVEGFCVFARALEFFLNIALASHLV